MKSPTAAAYRRETRRVQNGARALALIAAIGAVSDGCASRGEPEPAPDTPPVTDEVVMPEGTVWLARASAPAFVPMRDSTGGISIEYPKQDWLSAPGGLTTLAAFTRKDGRATVVLERSELNQALAPEEITEVFGQIEIDTIRERTPEASDFDTRLLDHNGARVVAIQYRRPGAQGTQIVRQYSFPIGKTLYRLTCVLPPDRFAEYEPICAHMAASFEVLP